MTKILGVAHCFVDFKLELFEYDKERNFILGYLFELYIIDVNMTYFVLKLQHACGNQVIDEDSQKLFISHEVGIS